MFKLSLPTNNLARNSLDMASDQKRRIRMKLSLSKERDISFSHENNINSGNISAQKNNEFINSPKELDEDFKEDNISNFNFTPKLEFSSINKFQV